MTDLVGKVVDKYLLTRLIGRGGMGAVYEAEHTLVGKRCALKLLHPQFSTDPDIVKRMLREAQAAAAIGHPNIVETHDFGVSQDNQYYMIMDLLRGAGMDVLLAHRRRLEIKPTVAIMLQVLSALLAAHAKGIVHRDLKPENIFIAQSQMGEENVKLLDFGISLFQFSKDATERLTRAGVVMGTPDYMSPEQASGDEQVDARSDIWSIGVILYQALTGALPFTGKNYNQLIIKIATKPFAPPRQHRPDLPETLEAVILRALQKDPEQRFQRAQDLVTALLPFYDRSEAEAGRFTLKEPQLDRAMIAGEPPPAAATSPESMASPAASAPAPAPTADAGTAAAAPAPASTPKKETPPYGSGSASRSPQPARVPETKKTIIGTSFSPQKAAPVSTEPVATAEATPPPEAAAPEAAPTEAAPVSTDPATTAEATPPPEAAARSEAAPSEAEPPPEAAARSEAAPSEAAPPPEAAAEPSSEEGREITAQVDISRFKPRSRLPILIGLGVAAVVAVVVAIVIGRSTSESEPPSSTESAQADPTADAGRNDAAAPLERPSPTRPDTNNDADVGQQSPPKDAQPSTSAADAAVHSPASRVVRLSGLPHGAQVLLDGKPAPIPIRVTEDGREHRLEVRKKGYKPFVRRFNAGSPPTVVAVRLTHLQRPRSGTSARRPPHRRRRRRPPRRRRAMRRIMSPAMTSMGLYKNPFE